MRISQLAHKAGNAGSGNSWVSYHSTDTNGRKTLDVWHDGHNMLSVTFKDDGSPDLSTLYLSVGWGSVSDQGGMNQILRELRLPYYYSRQGGAAYLTIVGTE